MSYGVPQVEIITDDFENNINHRGRAYMAKNSVAILEDSDDVMGDSREKTTALFCRSSECEKVNLEDFQLMSVIGRGNFGKVYLVYLPQTRQYYAMKSIRKDIVLDNDSVENIKLEKLILLQVNNPFIVSMMFVFQRSYRIYFIMDYIK